MDALSDLSPGNEILMTALFPAISLSDIRSIKTNGGTVKISETIPKFRELLQLARIELIKCPRVNREKKINI